MIEFELNLNQMYLIQQLVTKLQQAYRDGERGMIISQITVPGMVVHTEFVENEKAKKIIEAMKK